RPVGTISARLSRARERLRVRLVRRGFALSAGVAGLTGNAVRAAGPPAALVDSTIRVAMASSSGKMAVVIPPAIAALSRGVTRSMFVAKLTMISATALAIGVAAGMAVLARQERQGQAAPGEASAGPSSPGPKAAASATVVRDDPLPVGARLRLGT